MKVRYPNFFPYFFYNSSTWISPKNEWLSLKTSASDGKNHLLKFPVSAKAILVTHLKTHFTGRHRSCQLCFAWCKIYLYPLNNLFYTSCLFNHLCLLIIKWYNSLDDHLLIISYDLLPVYFGLKKLCEVLVKICSNLL